MLSQLLLQVSGVFIAAFVVIYSYIKWTHDYWGRLGVPYIPTSFPWGNIHNPITQRENPSLQFKGFYDECKKRGWQFGGVIMVISPELVLADPEVIRAILVKDFDHFVDRGFYTNEEIDPLAGHLFVLAGMKWKMLRAKLTPTFTSGKMKMMFETLVNCSDPLHQVLDTSSTNKESVDVKEVFACFTTDVIGSCAFGLDCNSFKNPESEFRKYGNEAFRSDSMELALKVVFATNFPTIAKFIRLKLTPKAMEDFFINMVEATVRLRQTENIHRKDFVQLLMQMLKTGENPNGITMHEMAAQGFVFFLAGFETSSNTGSFCLYELAHNQPVQNRVREEIRAVVQRHGGKLTYEGVQEMKYLGQVVDETLRKHPPLAFLNRTCTKQYAIPGTDVRLEKGTRVLISTLGLHNDPEYFPEPEVFDPERFSEENKGKIAPFTYMPFGEGPRNCIGLRFGLMQVKVGLAAMVKDFRFSVGSKTETPLQTDPKSFTYTSLGGIWLDVERV